MARCCGEGRLSAPCADEANGPNRTLDSVINTAAQLLQSGHRMIAQHDFLPASAIKEESDLHSCGD